MVESECFVSPLRPICEQNCLCVDTQDLTLVAFWLSVWGVVASNLIFVHLLWNGQIFNILKSVLSSLHLWHDSIFRVLMTCHLHCFKLDLYVLFLHVCIFFIATLFVRCLYSIVYFNWYKIVYIILISFSECSFIRNFAKNLLSQRLNSVVTTKEIVIYIYPAQEVDL